MRYFVLVLVCIPFCSGCVVTKVHTMPVSTFSAAYDQTWDASIAYLNKEKEPIVTADKGKGIILTDWVNMHKVFSVKRYRYNIEITKLEENQTKIGIASPQEAYSMGDWEEMLPNERRAHRMFNAIRRSVKISGSGISGKVAYRPFNKRQRKIPRPR